MSERNGCLERLSDGDLMATADRLVVVHRKAAANLLACLVEVVRRDLHLVDGASTLADWCMARWGVSEDQAWTYTKVVEVARKWPLALEMVADGRLSLSGVRALRQHLSNDNAEERLREAAGKTRQELQLLMARWTPRADVPGRVVRLPARRSAAAPVAAKTAASESSRDDGLQLAAPKPKHRVEPLSEARFKVQLTVDARVAAKLEEAMALAGHQVGAGDYERLFEMALDAFLAAKKKQRFGVGRKAKSRKVAAVPAPAERAEASSNVGPTEGTTERGQPTEAQESAETSEQAGPKERSRAIPADVKRAVVERDGLRCTYHGPSGRCREQRRLEFHHHAPFAKGGAHSADNISLLCQAHNQLIARQELGADFMQRKRAARAEGGRTRSALDRIPRAR